MKNINLKLILICLLCLMQVILLAQKMVTISSPTSIDEPISIYPNPVQGKAIVSFLAKQEGYIQINVFGIDGKKIISTGDNLKEGENSFQLSLPKGTYVIHLKGNGFSYSGKVISQTNGKIKPEIVFNGYVGLQATNKPLKTISLISNTLVTTEVSSISATMATSGGTFVNGSNGYILYKGVCWSTSSAPTTSNSKTTEGAGALDFTSTITGLTPLTTYYLRAYSFSTYGITDYGNEVIFTTVAPALAQLATIYVHSITSSTATSGGYIVSDQGTPVTARGVCWSTTENPTTANSKTTDGTGTGGFTSYISGLTLDVTYYVRAYATNLAGTSYGSQKSFIAKTINLPILTTNATSSITSTNATSGGNISSDGGDTVTARGVCWSTTINPTTANSKTTNGTGIGSFASSINGLTGGVTYYVRAYAINSAGTAYGNQISFTTTATTIDLIVSMINITDDSGLTPVGELLAFKNNTVVTSTFIVKNQGSGNSPASTVNYYLSRDPNLTDFPSYNLLVSTATSTIAAGESFTSQSVIFRIPLDLGSTAATTYYIYAVVDQNNSIAESDETNNVYKTPIFIYGGANK